MNQQVDKKWSERELSVGQWVYLKLQPYVQSSLAPQANQNLPYNLFGSFRVLSRIGSVTYKLQLPQSSQVQPVYHVSQLKQAIPADPSVVDLPRSLDGIQAPERVLQWRVSSVGTDVVLQILIKWSDLHWLPGRTIKRFVNASCV